MESAEAKETLRAFVNNLKDGELNAAQENTLINLLIRTWHLFSGSSETKMYIEKLDRIYDVIFKSPDVITFKIVRHGATVGGSSYAHVHKWTLNTSEMEAIFDPNYKKILVGEIATPLKTTPLAKSVADAIINIDYKNMYLEWKADNKVKVIIGSVIPETKSKQQRHEESVSEMNWMKCSNLMAGPGPSKAIFMKNNDWDALINALDS